MAAKRFYSENSRVGHPGGPSATARPSASARPSEGQLAAAVCRGRGGGRRPRETGAAPAGPLRGPGPAGRPWQWFLEATGPVYLTSPVRIWGIFAQKW